MNEDDDVTVETDGTNAVELATELTIAWLSNPNTRVDAEAVPGFLQRMHEALSVLAAGGSGEADAGDVEAPQAFKPAVSVRKSLARSDVIISMIDGKPYKTLRRHLNGHGLTPEEYRERYGLKADYPMVAPEYSEARRDMAKRIGLGRKQRDQAEVATLVTEVPEQAPKARRRGGRLGVATAQ